MNNVLTIAKWEIARLLSRFSGRSRLVVLPVLLVALISSYLIYHQDFVICKNLYVVGVSGDSPVIADKRFSVVRTDPDTGYSMLRKGDIDLFVNGNEVMSRNDRRSQYAAGALQKYLESRELARIASQYEIDRAFPLRVEIRYLDTPEPSPGNGTGRPKPQAEEMEEPGVPSAGIPAAAPVSEPEVHGAEPQPATTPVQSETAGGMPSPASDTAVRQRLEEMNSGSGMPVFKAEFASENDIIIPSLTKPPIPLAQVLIAFLYVVPIFFVSVFFTSSFTEEKVNRKLVVLLSAPVSRFQVILGKMLPYLAYSLAVIIGITGILRGSIPIALATFVPVMLFIFSIYLMVALTYRTFKDQTFFSVLALSGITVYLVVPAMFTGVNNLSYISPLTLAVEMYRGEPFGISEYFLGTAPLYVTFLLTMFVGTRVFNEEYLMGFKPLHTKAADALNLAMDRDHQNVSVFALSLFMIPAVFVIEMVSIVFVYNLHMPFTLWLLVGVCAITEEIAKSTGVAVLLRSNAVRTPKDIIRLSFLSASGFLLGEKLLLFLTMSLVTESKYILAVFGGQSGGWLLAAPLILHTVTTSVVCLLTSRWGTRYYPLAIAAGSLIHFMYNISIAGAAL